MVLNTLNQRTIEPLEQFLIAGEPQTLRQFGAPARKPETYPNRVAILHRGIKRTHSDYLPMHQAPVDLDEKIGVGRIVAL